MIKTAEDIERDLYRLIRASQLGQALRGSVYRSEMRPYAAESEDAVVKLLAGLDEQIQTGVIVVNIYIPDKLSRPDGRKVIDHARAAELLTLVRAFVESSPPTEYRLTTDATPLLMYDDEIEQHFIYARIKYSRLSD